MHIHPKMSFADALEFAEAAHDNTQHQGDIRDAFKALAIAGTNLQAEVDALRKQLAGRI